MSVSFIAEGASVMAAVCEHVFDRYFYPQSARSRHAVTDLESRLSGLLNDQPVVGTSSGTDALILALRAGGVGSGDEVIVPGYGCPAVPAAVAWLGATPVFTDVASGDRSLIPEAVREAVTERTKAVIFTHHFGIPSARVQEVRTIADTHALMLIEDIAQVFGGSIAGSDGTVPVGTIGHVACMSFTTGKPFATFGSAGAVTAQDEVLVETVRMMATYGARVPYVTYPVVGVNARLDPIHAVILTAKLKYCNRRFVEWHGAAAYYREQLDGIPEVTLPVLPEGDRFTYPEFVLQTQDRDALLAHIAGQLRGEGRIPRAAYPVAACDIPVYGCRGEDTCVNAHRLADTSLALPLSCGSSSMQRIAGMIRTFYRST